MNTSIKFILDSKALSNGMHTVYMQIIKNRKKKNIAIGFKCLKENFVDDKFTRGHKTNKTDNEVLTSFRAKAERIIEMKVRILLYGILKTSSGENQTSFIVKLRIFSKRKFRNWKGQGKCPVRRLLVTLKGLLSTLLDVKSSFLILLQT